MLAPYITDLRHYHEAISPGAFCGISVLSCFIYMLLPETKKKALSDTGEDLDKFSSIKLV